MQEFIDFSLYENELTPRAPRLMFVLESAGNAALDISDSIKRKLGDQDYEFNTNTWEAVPDIALNKPMRSTRRIRAVGLAVVIAGGMLSVPAYTVMKYAVDNIDLHLFDSPWIIDPTFMS